MPTYARVRALNVVILALCKEARGFTKLALNSLEEVVIETPFDFPALQYALEFILGSPSIDVSEITPDEAKALFDGAHYSVIAPGTPCARARQRPRRRPHRIC